MHLSTNRKYCVLYTEQVEGGRTESRRELVVGRGKCFSAHTTYTARDMAGL